MTFTVYILLKKVISGYWSLPQNAKVSHSSNSWPLSFLVELSVRLEQAPEIQELDLVLQVSLVIRLAPDTVDITMCQTSLGDP